jgi:hypothetical protein
MFACGLIGRVTWWTIVDCIVFASGRLRSTDGWLKKQVANNSDMYPVFLEIHYRASVWREFQEF